MVCNFILEIYILLDSGYYCLHRGHQEEFLSHWYFGISWGNANNVLKFWKELTSKPEWIKTFVLRNIFTYNSNSLSCERCSHFFWFNLEKFYDFRNPSIYSRFYPLSGIKLFIVTSCKHLYLWGIYYNLLPFNSDTMHLDFFSLFFPCVSSKVFVYLF